MIIRNVEELKQWLKDARKEKHLSQHQLSIKTRLSYETIGRIESRERTPNMSTVFLICDALGYDLIIKKKGEEEDG